MVQLGRFVLAPWSWGARSVVNGALLVGVAVLSVPVSTVESERNEREKQRASGRAGTAGGREERLGGREERLGAPTTSFLLLRERSSISVF